MTSWWRELSLTSLLKVISKLRPTREPAFNRCWVHLRPLQGVFLPGACTSSLGCWVSPGCCSNEQSEEFCLLLAQGHAIALGENNVPTWTLSLGAGPAFCHPESTGCGSIWAMASLWKVALHFWCLWPILVSIHQVVFPHVSCQACMWHSFPGVIQSS